MIKKIVLMFGLVFMIVPISNAFAYEDGLLNGRTLQAGKGFIEFRPGIYSSLTDVITDGSSSTSIRFSFYPGYVTQVQYKFDTPLMITDYQIEFNGPAPTIRLYDSDVNLLYSGKLVKDAKTQIGNIENVTYVNLFYSGTSDYSEVKEFDVFGEKVIYHQELSNLILSATHESVSLNWNTPINNTDFSGTAIYRDGELINTVGESVKNFTDNGLLPEKTYTYKVVGLYKDGFSTDGVEKSVKTLRAPEPLLLKGIEVKTEFDKVDLTWGIPYNTEFKHVNIYRDIVQEQTALKTFFFGESVKAAETKIFETNGTYFNDLTVEPETTYEYTLSITDRSGQETGYTDIEVTTPEEPPPILKDGNLEETETGDYKYTWSEPTEGNVKILIGGQEYATVDAANKEIIIPKADMKYTAIGDPDVSAIPISESGKEGTEAKPPSTVENVQLPFDYKELVNAGSQLLWIIAPFVLLALSFLLVPKLRRLIVNAFRGKNGKKIIETERRTLSERTERKDKLLLKRERMEKENIDKDKSEKAPKVDSREIKKSKEIKVRERAIRQPKIHSERTIKEPRISSRISKETRQVREGRQSLREPRLPREIRKGGS